MGGNRNGGEGMKNTFGNSVAVTLFGESHGPAVGAVLDGLAPGIPVDEDFISWFFSFLSVWMPAWTFASARMLFMFSTSYRLRRSVRIMPWIRSRMASSTLSDEAPLFMSVRFPGLSMMSSPITRMPKQ